MARKQQFYAAVRVRGEHRGSSATQTYDIPPGECVPDGAIPPHVLSRLMRSGAVTTQAPKAPEPTENEE